MQRVYILGFELWYYVVVNYYGEFYSGVLKLLPRYKLSGGKKGYKTFLFRATMIVLQMKRLFYIQLSCQTG